MKAIAASETSRKKGRRTDSSALESSPHAPPLFLASMNAMWFLQMGMAEGMPSRRFLAHTLVRMSLASDRTDTTTRKTGDGGRVST